MVFSIQEALQVFSNPVAPLVSSSLAVQPVF